MAELLVTDDNMMELMKMGYCYEFIAREIGVPVQVVDFKGQMMRKKCFDIKPFVETSADFLRYY
ncbi:hypothetical protein SH1V18_38270 [Vallitalea longa]|uniref:Uncharacterized protein n=1 Tax=Vallitalea longa TaxID=2936439 RepID=A0A9W5YD89_9FIRM|nr:hypothetical protein SH1V18_38270 [Vallitalea longa]